MTRDLSYYFEKSYDEVFNAFHRAALEKFGKDCRVEEGKVLSFGLDFSFRYNMNGGALRVFFMSYGTGTAVNLHYIIAQLWGARYGAHAKAVIEHVESVLNVRAREMQIPLERFQAYQHTSAPAQPRVQAQSQARKVCPSCQNVVPADSRFCFHCGKEIPALVSFCSGCGYAFQDGDKFCPQCGSKR